jgi:tetratricopeptide (TPR) repeat protein
VKKQQLILVLAGAVVLLVLYFFGNTIPPKKEAMVAAQKPVNQHKAIEFQVILQAARQKLTPNQQAYLAGLESSVVRGDVKDQQVKVYRQMAAFWRDTVHYFEPSAYYTAAAAKLENSEKSLTFAAHQFLRQLKGTNQPLIKQWMADQAKELFEKALVLNPGNDSSKIGLGSCYIFGSTAENPQEVMTGIQKILEVAKRDSTNMYAQLMLGIGGVVSGQLDKAVERLHKVVDNEPDNLEAIFMLADAYERKEDKADAVKWYTESKKYISDKQMLTDIDQKIESLK